MRARYFSPVLLLVAGLASAAEPGQARGGIAATGAARGAPGRALLPDPVLLDGSTQPAEKRADYGMIGDFELPGDENANPSAKVGAPQGGGGGSETQAEGGREGAGRSSSPGGGGQESGQRTARADGEKSAPSGAGGQEGTAPIKPGEAGGQAQGTQVAELAGEAGGGQQAGDGSGQRPGGVSIGDKAMRIPSAQGTAGVVGAQQPASVNTQHHEKGVGKGAIPSAGQPGPNRVEKGRAIPSGL